MEVLAAINVLDIFLHLDEVLEQVLKDYHAWVYLLLFAILFCETGLVVTPFLPGDSLLFAAGALAAKGTILQVHWLLPLLAIAVILGDNSNYWIGRYIGPVIFSRQTKLLNKKHLDEAHAFYERWGGKTVFIARFAPILRTFAPFVAGIARMQYFRFFAYSVTGTICWIGSFVLGGYFFGNIPLVSKNFTVVIMAIIVISLMPAAIAFLKQKLGKKPVSERSMEFVNRERE